MKAELSSCVWFPAQMVSVAELRAALTVEHWQMGAEAPDRVTAVRTDRKGYIGVPRQFGLDYADRRGIEVVDRTSPGRPATIRKTVELREGQGEFIDDLLAQSEDDYDAVAKAGTGKGKTTMSLDVLRNLQSTAIIVVDQENLMAQWIERAQEQFGVTSEEIGIVQGPVCEYKGKTIVIAMVQTLVQRKMPAEFYDYFGVAVFDEVHVMGAPTYSRALMMFSARFRFGVSATPERGDSLDKLIGWNLGGVTTELSTEHRRSRVYYVESPAVFSWYANTSPKTGRYLQEISDDAERNWLCCSVVLRLRAQGHDVLVISDRIEQLEGLKTMCELAGLDPAETGLYTGYRTVWMFEKDPQPPRRPKCLQQGADYTPVRYAPVRKRIPKGELARIKEEAAVLFATYGMFQKGVDVPRLSAGVDCTPRSKAKQVHGRILRDHRGKRTPVWVTIRDTNSHRAEFQFHSRLGEYVASNAEIYEWHIEKGVRRVDVAELKREAMRNVARLKTCRYTTRPDGRVTVVTQTTPPAPGRAPGNRITRSTRDRRAR